MATFTNFSSLLCNAMTSGKLSPRTWLKKRSVDFAEKKTDKSGWQVDTNPRCVIKEKTASQKKNVRKVETNSTCKSVYFEAFFGCLNNKKMAMAHG